MNRESNKNKVVEILNYIYNKKEDFTFYGIDEELSENVSGYQSYSDFLPNTMVALVSIGRFKIEKNLLFVCEDRNAVLNDEQIDVLLDLNEDRKKRRGR